MPTDHTFRQKVQSSTCVPVGAILQGLLFLDLG